MRELHPAVPTSESDERADDAILAELLRGDLFREPAPSNSTDPRPRRTDDGNARRASFKAWLRERQPLVYAGLYDDPLLERQCRAALARIARVRREALAYCIECRNPLLATEQGFQFCPYERAGQHDKVRRELSSQSPIQLTTQYARSKQSEQSSLKASNGEVRRRTSARAVADSGTPRRVVRLHRLPY
ncbi:MAG TPA: hypothetical protein VNE82_12765 [Candidatus Binataceae bacterium]|nr:hypothetical protein [Candidatus Binataceae bacterium]